MDFPRRSPWYPLRYPISSASGISSLYRSIRAPMDEDKQGAMPPAVKNAIFFDILIGSFYFKFASKSVQISRLFAMRKLMHLPNLDAKGTNH